jgi:hypothetical protein
MRLIGEGDADKRSLYWWGQVCVSGNPRDTTARVNYWLLNTELGFQI